jgi:hypothetical protein
MAARVFHPIPHAGTVAFTVTAAATYARSARSGIPVCPAAQATQSASGFLVTFTAAVIPEGSMSSSASARGGGEKARPASVAGCPSPQNKDAVVTQTANRIRTTRRLRPSTD